MGTKADHNLIIRCREGDEEACRLLLSRYEAYVYRLCLGLSNSREDALDFTQEALMKVLAGLDKFQLGRPLKPWIRQVTINACLNCLRRCEPKTISLEQPIAEDIVLGDTIAGNIGNPEVLLEWQDAQEVIQREINRLPPQQRLVLVMRHREELSYEEISDTTGLPLGTVKTYLFRARQQLRIKLASVYGWEG